MMARYEIPDEPRPGALSGGIVDPMWPLFAQMLAGSWLALPWWLFNGYVLGSSTRARELAWVLASVAGPALLAWWLFVDPGNQDLSKTALRFGVLAIIAVKISCAYVLYTLQHRGFEIWRYYGGAPSRAALYVLIGGALLRGVVLQAIGANAIAGLVLS
jgi:hypothetical protein